MVSASFSSEKSPVICLEYALFAVNLKHLDNGFNSVK